MTPSLTTDVYATAIDAVDVDLPDIPKTLTAAADGLRAALAELGSWARPWRYQRLDNWPHAGFIAAPGTGRADTVADIHAATNAGAYLELMAPPMAAALVDWLTAAADRERERQANPINRAVPFDDPMAGDEVFAALVVAHTVLQVLSTRDQDPTTH